MVKPVYFTVLLTLSMTRTVMILSKKNGSIALTSLCLFALTSTSSRSLHSLGQPAAMWPSAAYVYVSPKIELYSPSL